MYSFDAAGLEKVMDSDYNITRMDTDKANFVNEGVVTMSVDIEQNAVAPKVEPSPTNGFEMS